jgi:hypothetical protein
VTEEEKKIEEVNNALDGWEEIGTIRYIAPSSKPGFDIVRTEKGTIRVPEGKYKIGDIIRGTRVPLEEWLYYEKTRKNKP